jgi:nucleoside 2-deoxyribosyltransferase
MVVYECGAMSAFYEQDRYEEATKWRNYVKDFFKETNIQVFDPTDNSELHFNYSADLHDGVIFQNYAYLKKCDIVLVNLDLFEDSIGSIWEVSTAFNDHKHIICFGRCNKWKSRPHFKSMFKTRLDTVEDACEYILSMYRQKIN